MRNAFSIIKPLALLLAGALCLTACNEDASGISSPEKPSATAAATDISVAGGMAWITGTDNL